MPRGLNTPFEASDDVLFRHGAASLASSSRAGPRLRFTPTSPPADTAQVWQSKGYAKVVIAARRLDAVKRRLRELVEPLTFNVIQFGTSRL
jgi:hypothetical protein